jgi:hypothetical protein
MFHQFIFQVFINFINKKFILIDLQMESHFWQKYVNCALSSWIVSFLIKNLKNKIYFCRIQTLKMNG